MCKSFSLPYFEVSAAANAFIQCLLLLPVLYCGRAFYIFGFRTLLRFVPNMDSLIALCTSSAVIYSFYLLFTGSPGKLYFDSAAMILTFIMLGKFLEERCKGKASKAVRELMKLTPETAHIVKKDGKEYPMSYLYENANGQRFLVFNFDADQQLTSKGLWESYYRQKQVLSLSYF